jgi:hypothetical protein
MVVDSHGLRFPACLDHLVVVLILTILVVCPSSLAPQSSPEQSSRSLIYGRRLSVKRPMDLNALLFCARMMSEGRTHHPSTSVVVLHPLTIESLYVFPFFSRQIKSALIPLLANLLCGFCVFLHLVCLVTLPFIT